VVLEIVNRGDWLLPRRNGLELPAKPPLFHWLGAVASRAQGKADEWSIRLPSAVLSLVATLVVFATGALIWGVRPALLAALALLTSFEWLRAATSARVDMTLTFGLTLAFCGLLLMRARHHPAWLVLAYGGSAWAVLAKGPVGIVLPLLQVVAISAIDRRLEYVRRLHLWRGLVAVGFVAAAWYAAAWVEGGRQFFETQIMKENVYRFIGTRHFTAGHRHSIVFLLLACLGGLLPWSLFLPSVGTTLWRQRSNIGRGDPRWFATVWILVVFAFYASATSKRGVYLLALYPAAVLLLGWWWDTVLRGYAEVAWLRMPLAATAWCVALILGVGAVAAGVHAGIPLFASSVAHGQDPEAQLAAALGDQTPVIAALLAAATVAAVVTANAASAARWGIVYVGILTTLCSVSVLARQIVLPVFGRAVSRERFLGTVLRIVPDRALLSSYHRFDYGLAFYWGGDLPVARPPLSAAGTPYVIIAEREWSRLGPVERDAYERVPGIRSGRAGNLGELVLLHRHGNGGAGEPPKPPDLSGPTGSAS